MNCRKMQNWILLEQSGELSVFKRLRLRRHIAHCQACRLFADETVRIQSAVDTQTPEISAFTRNRITQAGKNAIERRERPGIRRTLPGFAETWRPAIVYTAMAVVILIVGVAIQMNLSSSPRLAKRTPPSSIEEELRWDGEIEEELAEIETMILVASRDMEQTEETDEPTETEALAIELLQLEETSS